MLRYNYVQRSKLGEELVFEIRQPGTVAQYMIKSSLFILLPNSKRCAGTEAQ
jgi:hypothetical protein